MPYVKIFCFHDLYPPIKLVIFSIAILYRKKYKIGIIANQSLGTEERLAHQGILKFINLIVASAEEGVAKPDRRIFEIALERSNCKPVNAIMIGDRIDNDIIPAKRMGMNTIWIY